MSKSIKFMSTLFLSIIVLAACNTAEEATTETGNESETVTEHTEGKEVNQPADTEKPTTQDGVEKEPSTDETNTSITFSSNGTSKTEKLTTVTSEQYSMQVIPGFSLSQEEPGKDVLSLDEDDNVYMRIEPMTTDDTTYDELVANTELLTSSIDENYKPYDIASYVKGKNLTNSTAYVAAADNFEIITVVYEKADQLVRLTIFDDIKADLSEAMLKMGLTVE